ncbi:unnamed protein product [Lampetra fluviatilis]
MSHGTQRKPLRNGMPSGADPKTGLGDDVTPRPCWKDRKERCGRGRTGTLVGGPGVAIPAGQRAKDDGSMPPPAKGGLWALSTPIVGLLSTMSTLVGQLGLDFREKRATRGTKSRDDKGTSRGGDLASAMAGP